MEAPALNYYNTNDASCKKTRQGQQQYQKPNTSTSRTWHLVLTCSLQVAAEQWFQFFKYQRRIEMADWKRQKWGAWCQLIQCISRQLLSVLASTWDTSKAELLHCAVMFKLNLMKWLWSNSGTFWHIERLCYDRTMVINYLHLTHKDITTSQCKMYNLVIISGCCRCEQCLNNVTEQFLL